MALLKQYESKGLYPNYWKITERHTFENENRTYVVLELYNGIGARINNINNTFGINKAISISGCNNTINDCYTKIKELDVYFQDSLDILENYIIPENEIVVPITNDPVDETITRTLTILNYWNGEEFNSFVLNLKATYSDNRPDKLFTFVISNEFMIDGVGEYRYFSDILKSGVSIENVIIGGLLNNISKINLKLL